MQRVGCFPFRGGSTVAKKQYDDDDGRVVAPMNVDGMPWYRRGESTQETDSSDRPQVKMTREERAAFLGGALKAVLLVGGVFLGVYFLLILFLYLVM